MQMHLLHLVGNRKSLQIQLQLELRNMLVQDHQNSKKYLHEVVHIYLKYHQQLLGLLTVLQLGKQNNYLSYFLAKPDMNLSIHPAPRRYGLRTTNLNVAYFDDDEFVQVPYLFYPCDNNYVRHVH